MKEFLTNSVFFGVFISILTYDIGVFLKNKTGFILFNPLLISIALIIAILNIFDIEYSYFKEGSAYINYLLTPATVCLAIPLYEKLNVLKDNFKAIMLGITSGVLTSLVCIFLLSLLFKLGHREYVTLLPKSITTAIGIDISKEFGGIPAITIAVIVITGVFGNACAEIILKIFKIKNPIAKGVGIGTAAHAMGTTKAMELGEVEGAMSSLSIAVAGLITVIGASIFANFI